jgi:hypothetical protein
MPYAASIGAYPPCWGTPRHRGATDGFRSGDLAETLGWPEFCSHSANRIGAQIGGSRAATAVTILEGLGADGN